MPTRNNAVQASTHRYTSLTVFSKNIASTNIASTNIASKKNTSGYLNNTHSEKTNKTSYLSYKKLIRSRHEIVDHIQALVLREQNYDSSNKMINLSEISVHYYLSREKIITFYCDCLQQTHCDLSIATKAMSMLDRYVSSDHHDLKRENLQEFESNLHCFVIGAFSLAAKTHGGYENVKVSYLLRKIGFYMKSINMPSLEQYELKMLNQLNWHVDIPETYDYARYFLQLAVSFIDDPHVLHHEMKKILIDVQNKIIFVLKTPKIFMQYNRFDIGLGIGLNALNADLQHRHGYLTPAEHVSFKFVIEYLLKNTVRQDVIQEIQAELMWMPNL